MTGVKLRKVEESGKKWGKNKKSPYGNGEIFAETAGAWRKRAVRWAGDVRRRCTCQVKTKRESPPGRREGTHSQRSS
jgi:hypothetical protein